MREDVAGQVRNIQAGYETSSLEDKHGTAGETATHGSQRGQKKTRSKYWNCMGEESERSTVSTPAENSRLTLLEKVSAEW